MAFLIRGVNRLGRKETDLSKSKVYFFGSLLLHKIQYVPKETAKFLESFANNYNELSFQMFVMCTSYLNMHMCGVHTVL